MESEALTLRLPAGTREALHKSAANAFPPTTPNRLAAWILKDWLENTPILKKVENRKGGASL